MSKKASSGKPFLLTATQFALSLGMSFWMTAAHAQNLRVTAANSSNSAVYGVSFDDSGGGAINALNTDQNTRGSIRSLVYVPNATSGKIDLLAADSSRGQILLYPGGEGVATVIWSTTQGAGPTYPDGLSVDSAGNLFIVSSGTGNPKPAQLWVMPRNNPAGQWHNPVGGDYGLPRLIDSDFIVTGFGPVPVQQLAETLVARASGATGLGDLLVLASDPATVLVYSKGSITPFLSSSPPSGEINPSSVLIGSSQFPLGAVPGGMDFWPIDNSLLITIGSGRILRYSAAGTQLADFASGLGNGKYKIRTGLQSSKAFAFVANNNGGNILKFSDKGGVNPPVATVTTGVQSPQGLTTTNLAVADLATCASNGGCDVLGGVIKHNIKVVNGTTLEGFLIEEPCVVQTDPRINPTSGVYTKRTLPVEEVCPGFGNTVIPDFLYGGAGSANKGFALVKSSSATPITKGALITSEAYVESVLGSSPIPVSCPQTVLAWAPTAGEGSIAEGNAFAELTNSCHSSIGDSRDESLWGIGLTLKADFLTGGFVGFAVTKYDYLNSTIAAASIQNAFQRKLSKCISDSRSQFDRARYINAAGQLLTCDTLVAQNETQFAGSANNPNPSGDIRSRIANLYLTINSRILSNAPPTSWPPGS